MFIHNDFDSDDTDRVHFEVLFYLLLNYKTFTNYIIIIYELSDFDYGRCSVATRVYGGTQNHDHYANNLAH